MDEENIHINSIYFVQFNKMARHVLIQNIHPLLSWFCS